MNEDENCINRDVPVSVYWSPSTLISVVTGTLTFKPLYISEHQCYCMGIFIQWDFEMYVDKALYEIQVDNKLAALFGASR
jgi:hypothetical protein